jgi:hypothetical protein
MKFEELNDMIPYVMGGKEKVLRMSPYPDVTLAMPGRHAKDTTPKGGDFVVMVTDREFVVPEHQFTHTDIFNDVERRILSSSGYDRDLMAAYLDVIQGGDPDKYDLNPLGMHVGGTINRATFIHAVQCLAVAEHRRYAKFEPQFGGRFLPFRFAAGISEGLWTAHEATALQKKGRPGVERLEKEKGVPSLTKELMG